MYDDNEKVLHSMDYLMFGETLEHFGVPGMRWGVRKSLSNSMGSFRNRRQARRNVLNDRKIQVMRTNLKNAKRLYKARKKISKLEGYRNANSIFGLAKIPVNYIKKRNAKKEFKSAKKAYKEEYRKKFNKELQKIRRGS